MNKRFEELGSTLFGSAPVEDKLIFMSKEKEQEWKDLPEGAKKFAMENLITMVSKMENKVAIEMLCHAMNDMHNRINELEKKLKDQNDQI